MTKERKLGDEQFTGDPVIDGKIAALVLCVRNVLGPDGGWEWEQRQEGWTKLQEMIEKSKASIESTQSQQPSERLG